MINSLTLETLLKDGISRVQKITNDGETWIDYANGIFRVYRKRKRARSTECLASTKDESFAVQTYQKA